MCLSCLITKKGWLLCESMFIPIEIRTSILKIVEPIRRMCLWSPIMKGKEIIMWIHVYPKNKMNFNSKNGGKSNFSYETKVSMSFIPTRRMCLWCPIVKERRLLCESIFVLIERRTSILIMIERKVFRMKPMHQYHLSQ